MHIAAYAAKSRDFRYDLKTFAALGADGCAVPVALTAQNAEAVRAIHIVPPAFVTQQLDAVFAGTEIGAVKIGMLGTAAIVEVVADALRRHRPAFVVLDPVIRATSGAVLLDEPGVELLRREFRSSISSRRMRWKPQRCLARRRRPPSPRRAWRPSKSSHSARGTY